jgi:hypothetical protein
MNNFPPYFPIIPNTNILVIKEKEKQDFIDYVDVCCEKLKPLLHSGDYNFDKFKDIHTSYVYEQLWLFVCKHIQVLVKQYQYYRPNLDIFRMKVFETLLYDLYTQNNVQDKYENDVQRRTLFLSSAISGKNFFDESR